VTDPHRLHAGAPPTGGPATGRDAVRAAALALGLALAYSANGDFLPGNDATPNVYLAAQVLNGGGLSFTPSGAPHLFEWTLRTPAGPSYHRVRDLDERVAGSPARDLYRRGLLVPTAPYYLGESVRSDPVSGERVHVGLFGVGAALSAVPLLAPVRAVAGDLVRSPAALWYGAKVAASLLAAGSAAFVFLLVRRWLSPAWALALAAAYGLGTPVWSTSSQSLWQHASNELFLAAGAFFLARGRGGVRDAALAGVAFAAATACRPTSALFSVAAAGWLLLVDRRALAGFVAGSLPIALALAGYNWHFLGSPLRFGQGTAHAVALAKTGSPDLWRSQAWTAAAGLFASPSRGLLVFSPFLALAFPSAVAAFRRPEYRAMRPLAIGGLLVLAVDVAWFDWWGGWSYGWRRLVDLAPVLTLLVVPAVPAIARTRWRTAAFAGAVGWAVLLQGAGAFAYDLWGWNARTGWRLRIPSGREIVALDPQEASAAASGGATVLGTVTLDVDRPEHRHRLWSLEDNPIAYYLANFGAARRSRGAGVEQWLDRWRPPPPGPGSTPR